METVSTDRRDVYAIITEQIIERLERGTVPWQRPWQGGGLPLNLVSRKAYRGINVWMLASAGYVSPYWISFKQAKQLGGYVRKGEKSLPVVFWKVDEKPDPENPDATRKCFILRYYNAFNTEQCDLPESVTAKLALPEPKEIDPIDACDQIVTAMPNPPAIEQGEPRAYYSPAIDRVNMPARGLFDGAAEYYSTLFHELGHSTGHRSRLDRETITDVCPFGSTNYSKEELIAEMTAAFLCGVCGIENRTIDNSAAYVAGWLRKLRDDRRLVVIAAAQAQRAADYIAGKQAGAPYALAA